MKTVYKVTFHGGAAGEILITADSLDDVVTKMKAHFRKTPNYDRCLITSIEYMGHLWEDI